MVSLKKPLNQFMAIFILVVWIVSFAIPTYALAEGELPETPAETQGEAEMIQEPPAAPEAETGTDTAGTSTDENITGDPAGTSDSETSSETPPQASPETPAEIASEPPVEASPEQPVETSPETPVETSPETPVEASPATVVETTSETPVEASPPAPPETTLAAAPPETPSIEPVVGLIETAAATGLGIALLDSQGETVSLASQEAAAILADPQFCWEDTTTSTVTCGASHATLDAALADAYAHNFTANEVGIIIIEAGTFAGGQVIQPANWGANTAPSSFQFRGVSQIATTITSGLTISNFSNAVFYLSGLNIQGGLVFDGNDNTNITLEDVTLNNSAGTGLVISNQTGAGGVVQLTGVTSSGNSGSGADIQVQNSGATVLISDSQFSNNGNYGFYIAANNVVSISNVQALNNANHSLIDTDYGAGSGIAVLDSQFSSTGSDGLRLFSGGNTYVSNSTFSSSASGSGLSAWSNIDTSIYCSTANSNGSYGYDVGAGGTNYLLGIKGSANGLGLYAISGGGVDYRPNYCCSSYCPSPVDSETGEVSPIGTSLARAARLDDVIVPVYMGTDGNVGTLLSGRNLVFQLFSRGDGSPQQLLVEVKVASFSTLPGTVFGMKPLALDSLPVPDGSQMVGPVFIMDLFGLARSTLTYLEGYMEIKFILPDDFELPSGMALAVHYFDDETNQWQRLPSFRVDNTIYAYHDLMGTYALLLVPAP